VRKTAQDVCKGSMFALCQLKIQKIIEQVFMPVAGRYTGQLRTWRMTDDTTQSADLAGHS
jgi:hypothetical protein